MHNDKLVKNAAGRLVPRLVNGREQIAYQGVGKYRPEGRKYGAPIRSCADYPTDGNKLQPGLKEALLAAGLRDGVTISTHHHFRDGDIIANQVFDIAAELGIKNLVWAPSASFPCHEPIIEHLKSGVVDHIEGSMNGALGSFCSTGGMRSVGVLRSHGARYQAIQDGELHIDIAVIAAPAADSFGNASGLQGDSACGHLGYAKADAMYGDRVIVVTDHLVSFPCMPAHIHGNDVDYTVVVNKVGIPEKIISGTTKVTKSPDRLLLAEFTARFCEDAGLLRDGFSFQAGVGGTALAISNFLGEAIRERKLSGCFAHGGSNAGLVRLLEDGVLKCVLDAQAFDLAGVESLKTRLDVFETTPFTSYNYHGKGNFASMLDVVILGATEVDVNFNANVVSHSDGKLAHGIGGWQDCLYGKCVILPLPLFRNRIPTIRRQVTTLCGPGELIDVIVTERGIAINPRRTDLLAAVQSTNLPIVTIEELLAMVDRICGIPADPPVDEEIVAVIKWVDGTLLDVVYRQRS